MSALSTVTMPLKTPPFTISSRRPVRHRGLRTVPSTVRRSQSRTVPPLMVVSRPTVSRLGSLSAPARVRRPARGRARPRGTSGLEDDGLARHAAPRRFDDDARRAAILAAILAPTFLFLVSALAPKHLFPRRLIAELLAVRIALPARRLHRPRRPLWRSRRAVLAASGPVPDSRARPSPTQTN